MDIREVRLKEVAGQPNIYYIIYTNGQVCGLKKMSGIDTYKIWRAGKNNYPKKKYVKIIDSIPNIPPKNIERGKRVTEKHIDCISKK